MTVTVVDAGPRKISRSAEVNAPGGEIFEMVADPRRHGELDGSGTEPEAQRGRHRGHAAPATGPVSGHLSPSWLPGQPA